MECLEQLRVHPHRSAGGVNSNGARRVQRRNGFDVTFVNSVNPSLVNSFDLLARLLVGFLRGCGHDQSNSEHWRDKRC